MNTDIDSLPFSLENADVPKISEDMTVVRLLAQLTPEPNRWDPVFTAYNQLSHKGPKPDLATALHACVTQATDVQSALMGPVNFRIEVKCMGYTPGDCERYRAAFNFRLRPPPGREYAGTFELRYSPLELVHGQRELDEIVGRGTIHLQRLDNQGWSLTLGSQREDETEPHVHLFLRSYLDAVTPILATSESDQAPTPAPEEDILELCREAPEDAARYIMELRAQLQVIAPFMAERVHDVARDRQAMNHLREAAATHMAEDDPADLASLHCVEADADGKPTDDPSQMTACVWMFKGNYAADPADAVLGKESS